MEPRDPDLQDSRFVETVDVPREVARLRRQFADQVESLDETAWNTASWCTDWRVRDVLAHLVRGAEMTPLSLTRVLVRGGLRPDRAVSNAAKQLGDVPVAELADRLRTAADGGSRPPDSPRRWAWVMSSCIALTPSGLSATMSMRRQATRPLYWTPFGGEVECSYMPHLSRVAAWWRQISIGPKEVDQR
jgi:hypothetical protein